MMRKSTLVTVAVRVGVAVITVLVGVGVRVGVPVGTVLVAVGVLVGVRVLVGVAVDAPVTATRSTCARLPQVQVGASGPLAVAGTPLMVKSMLSPSSAPSSARVVPSSP